MPLRICRSILPLASSFSGCTLVRVSALSDRLAAIQSRIAAACQLAGRNPSDVALMAVSKNHPAAAVDDAIQLGLTLFGESRVQEARSKIPECSSRARWHFIGHLQSNKAREAVALFSRIEAVDSLDLARELQRQADKQSKHLPILLEINVSGESSKFGWSPGAILDALPDLRAFNRLELQGFMTIAPYFTDPDQARPVFRRLRELRDTAADRLGFPLPVLSMGMSGDLEAAIAEGSTVVRIGTALFGPRPQP
jgi:pyridoxal phosphate enzyme (YggS family)